jgi:hypothetical protein
MIFVWFHRWDIKKNPRLWKFNVAAGLKEVLVFIFSLSCGKDSSPEDPAKFANMPVSKRIGPGVIDEVSGIADSKINPGYLWVQQDSGNPNDITLLSYSGQIVKKINVSSSVNRDWEDLAIANGPVAGMNYLYIADIGDNNRVFSQYTIYRFPEPPASVDSVSSYDEIRFEYPDSSHDAEAIIVDNASKDIYIITKRDAVSGIYKLRYPQSTTMINTTTYVGALSFNGVVSAAISVSGEELLLKTYTSLYYWKKDGNESIEQVLRKVPVALGYQQEPQGEAVCFKTDNSGFYTISERPVSIPEVYLNFYQRK